MSSAADWSTTLQVVALGDVSSQQLDAGVFGNRTGLLTTETNASGDAGLWFYPTVSDDTLGQPVNLSTTGWKNLDLISPGDWSASQKPGLWARNFLGDITGYTFTTGTLTPVDEFGDPLPPVPTLTGIVRGADLGTVTTQTSTHQGSNGDLTGDGIPDLWSVSFSGALSVQPGITADGTSATAVTGFGASILAGFVSSAANQWPLKGGGADTDAVNAATPTGGVTWTADHNGSSPGASHLDGSTGYLRTADPALDTTKSYTASAWVKLNSTATTQTAVSQGTVNHQAFYLGYFTTSSTWYFMTTTSDNTTTSYPSVHGSTGAVGTWTHLTGVYDADSHVMSLYVNGVPSSTAKLNSTPVYNANAPLTIGGNITLGSTTPYNQFDGDISDVRTFPTALTADEIHTLYTTS